MNKNNRIILIAAIVIAGIIVLSQSIYVVNETQQVVITQFGRPIGVAVTEPGLHIKTPFVQKANFFEKRYMEWDGDPNQIPTKEKNSSLSTAMHDGVLPTRCSFINALPTSGVHKAGSMILSMVKRATR